MNGRSLQAMGVVVPAHNEEGYLEHCLASIRDAAQQVNVPTYIVVVLDRCTDGSARVVSEAARHTGEEVLTLIEGNFASVGSVRAAGTLRLAEFFQRIPSENIWTAHTDADSRVPQDWLAKHISLANEGTDLVIGSVMPDEPPHTPTCRLWLEQHPLGEGHSAIHGANMGIRLSCLEGIGGFRNLQVGEDLDVVARLKETGARWVATDSMRVVTSARRTGRVPQGFSAYLRDLDNQLGR
ncbi:glycosyltransferase [Rothia uropygialis]|uniref:glycosyltransferase n=1 Tax=Kocuria sp. 36 TaxID=1415402 RepID=UPI0013EA7F80|nr:glycosyltransferase [Kocuria sp. 36]